MGHFWQPKQDFCSCVRFHTLNKEYCVISCYLYFKEGSLFSYPKQGKSIGKKSFCIILPVRAHKKLKWEGQKKEGLMISSFIIKLTYFSIYLPYPFSIISMAILLPFFLIFHVFDTLNPVRVNNVFAVPHSVQVINGSDPPGISPCL